MRKYLIGLLYLCLCSVTWGSVNTTRLPFTSTASTATPVPYVRLARAIAKAEGFGRPGVIPTRYHNPGDIRALRGTHYPGQVGLNKSGYVIFRDDVAGWAALYHQIDKITAGESRHYTVTMTLRQLAKRYATSPVWVRNVSHSLGVPANTTLAEILDVPPIISYSPNHSLEGVL